MKLIMRVDALELLPNTPNAQVSLSTYSESGEPEALGNYEHFLDLEIPESQKEKYAPGKLFVVNIHPLGE